MKIDFQIKTRQISHNSLPSVQKILRAAESGSQYLTSELSLCLWHSRMMIKTHAGLRVNCRFHVAIQTTVH